MQVFKLFLGIADHDAKHAADRTSSEMRGEVRRMHDMASQLPETASEQSDEVDIFATLAHDMRTQQDRRAETSK